MKTMNKMKKYEKPSVMVVNVQNQLLAGSDEKRVTLQNYKYNDYVEE